MKILIYTSAFLPQIGGAELVVHNLAEGLVEEGHEVMVATFWSGGKDPISKYALKRLRSFRGSGRLGLRACARRWRLLKLIRDWRPDVIHAHFSIPCGYDLARLGERIEVPWILTCHGEDIQKRPEIPYGYRLDPAQEEKIRRAVCSAKAVIAIGEDVKAEYLSLGVCREKIFRLPNPIAYEALAEKKEQVRKKLGLAQDVPVVLAIGRNHPKKGFLRLLEAVAMMKERGVFCQCVLVGKDTGELEPYAVDLGLAGFIFTYDSANPAGLLFHGESCPAEKQIESFFQSADVYAMSSYVESFGLVTIEAMAAGLPVVAFSGPGTDDLLKKDSCGMVVPAGDVEAFANALQRCFENNGLREKARVCGQAVAFQYDRRIVARLHVDLYEKMAN